MEPEKTDVQYLVLTDHANPYLLARVRWPDVAQAITAACTVWQEDIGLFELPYDAHSKSVSLAEATEIAASWGAQLSSDLLGAAGPSVIRRMPANWSDLAPVEKRAWALEFAPIDLKKIADRLAGPDSTAPPVTAERRRNGRVRVVGRAHLICEQGAFARASLVDVSTGGAQCQAIESKSTPEIGRRLEPDLVLESERAGSRISLEVGGIVTWREKVDDRNRLGVAFDRMNDEQIDRLQRFLVALGPDRAA